MRTIQSAPQGLQPHVPLHIQVMYAAMAWVDVSLLLYLAIIKILCYVRSKSLVIFFRVASRA